MEDISIKVHPPWYARGTPVTNPRDGPPMAMSDKPLFANPITIGCRGPSARGEPGEDKGRGQGLAESEDRKRGETKGKTRSWLTLNTTFFNTRKRVYGQFYAQLGRDLSACGAPDNVKLEEDNVKLKMVDNVRIRKVDADRYIVDSDRSGDAVRSGEADLSACEAPENVKMNFEMMMENNDKKMVDADGFIGDADGFTDDADRSKDAVRSGEAVDLSACDPDNYRG